VRARGATRCDGQSVSVGVEASSSAVGEADSEVGGGVSLLAGDEGAGEVDPVVSSVVGDGESEVLSLVAVEDVEELDGLVELVVGDGDPEVPSVATDDVDSDGLSWEPTGGASSRMATISALKSSSRAVISVSEYAVISWAKAMSLPHTSPSACSCSSPGSLATDSTSWLAIAAVMQR
jgi:hypothetical protein